MASDYIRRTAITRLRVDAEQRALLESSKTMQDYVEAQAGE